MNLQVVCATEEQAPILANLLELYVHDFSEFVHLELGQDGRFGYEKLPLYWTEAMRHPFLISVDGRWAGFALVKRGSGVAQVARDPEGRDDVWDMGEFFVVRGQRRRGVGAAAAREVWRRFPGVWEVRVMERYQPAVKFWQGAVGSFTGCAAASTLFEKDGERWRLFRFLWNEENI